MTTANAYLRTQHPIPRTSLLARRMDFYNRLIPFHEIRFGQVDASPQHVERGLAMARRQLREAEHARWR